MRHMFVLDPFWRMLINHLSSLIVYKYLLHVDVPKNFINDLNTCFFIRNCFCLADASQKHLFFWLVYHGCHTSWSEKEDFENFVSHMRRWSRYVGPVVAEQLRPETARGLRPEKGVQRWPAERNPVEMQKSQQKNLCIRPKFKWLQAETKMMGGVTKFPFIFWKIPVHGVNFLQVPMLNFRWCKHMAESKSFSNQVADPSGLSYVDAMEPWTLESMMKVCKGWDWSWWMIYGDWNDSPGGKKIFLFFFVGGKEIIDSKCVDPCWGYSELFVFVIDSAFLRKITRGRGK